MTVARSAPNVSFRGRTPRWHLLYFVLAGFDLATVGLSFYLGHRVMSLYGRSLAETRAWTGRLSDFADLARAASDVNAPGNDVFDTRDVAAESAAMKRALRRFREKLRAIDDGFARDLPATDASVLSAHTDDIDCAMRRMVREGKQIFAHFRAGRSDLAGSRMATMDRRYAELRAAIAALDTGALALGNVHLVEQEAQAAWLKRFEAVLVVLILAMVGAVAVYGHRLAGQAARMSEALEREREAADLRARFVMMASHEFRTPLATIRAASDLLKRYGERMTSAERGIRVDKIQAQVAHMTSLLDDVLQFGRQDLAGVPCAPAPVDVEKLCEDVLASVREGSTETRRIALSLALRDARVVVDETLMRRVLGNLVGNALKFSGDDGRVEMSVSSDDAVLEVRVVDHGIGIPPEDRAHVFEPFHRGSNVGAIDGTGLGLAIAKSAVEAQGGTIHVEETPGHGATFIVRVPHGG